MEFSARSNLVGSTARSVNSVGRKVTAEGQLKRTDIRAPQDGTVFQSNIHTVGGVVTAGDTMMMVVPDADSLTVEAKANPQDIDQVQKRTDRAVASFRVQSAHDT